MIVKVTGVKQLEARLDALKKSGMRGAVSSAINDTLYGASLAVRKELKDSFPTATPYILNSRKVEKSTPEKLTGRVYIDDERTRGKGRAPSPAEVLMPHIVGGARERKASELGRFGWFVPGPGMPVDDRGNVRAADMVKVLSAAGMAEKRSGASMNQTARSRKKKGRMRGVYVIPGVGIFQHTEKSGDSLRSNNRWATAHGGQGIPLIFFVNAPHYQSDRFDFVWVVKDYTKKHFQKSLNLYLRAALKDALKAA